MGSKTTGTSSTESIQVMHVSYGGLGRRGGQKGLKEHIMGSPLAKNLTGCVSLIGRFAVSFGRRSCRVASSPRSGTAI